MPSSVKQKDSNDEQVGDSSKGCAEERDRVAPGQIIAVSALIAAKSHSGPGEHPHKRHAEPGHTRGHRGSYTQHKCCHDAAETESKGRGEQIESEMRLQRHEPVHSDRLKRYGEHVTAERADTIADHSDQDPPNGGC